MNIKNLRENLDKMLINSPFDENTKIKYCHMWGEKVQQGKLFIRACPKKNVIEFISSYFYYEIKSDDYMENILALTFNEAINLAKNNMLQNFYVFYTRGKTTSLEAVYQDGLEIEIE